MFNTLLTIGLKLTEAFSFDGSLFREVRNPRQGEHFAEQEVSGILLLDDF